MQAVVDVARHVIPTDSDPQSPKVLWHQTANHCLMGRLMAIYRGLGCPPLISSIAEPARDHYNLLADTYACAVLTIQARDIWITG